MGSGPPLPFLSVTLNRPVFVLLCLAYFSRTMSSLRQGSSVPQAALYSLTVYSTRSLFVHLLVDPWMSSTVWLL